MHNHNHDHINLESPITRSLQIGIVLNVIFVIVEFYFGFRAKSLALIGDAWHNVSDVAGLIISWYAFAMAKKKPTHSFTYGFSKATILATLANCVLLLIAVGSIGYESIIRLLNPVTPNALQIWQIAALGIIINTSTALLFLKQNELNSRLAFLHMLADALVSAAVLITGLLISYFQIVWLDAVMGIIISLVILFTGWKTLVQSFRLSLDGVPAHINIEKIISEIKLIPKVKKFYHIHVWALSTTKTALTAHVLTETNITDIEITAIKKEIRHILLHHKIEHCTLEFEV